MSKKGTVYILTNPCLDGWVKIGMTERKDIEERLRELNSPANIPLSYRCYATYSVENPLEVEKRIHSIIDKIDGELHAKETLASGKIRKREFFKISPEKAYGIFKDIATLRGDTDQLHPYAPNNQEAEEQEIAESSSSARRRNCTFAELNILPGEEIVFLYDDTIAAQVADEKNRVFYNGEVYSVSSLARKILTEAYGWGSHPVNGWSFFTKDGVTLSDLRLELEKKADADLLAEE